MKSLYLIKFPNSFHQDPSSSTNIPVTDSTPLCDALMQDKQAFQPSDDPYLDILKNVFHHQHFRDIQREAIECNVADKDALIVIPTGGGEIPMLLDSRPVHPWSNGCYHTTYGPAK